MEPTSEDRERACQLECPGTWRDCDKQAHCLTARLAPPHRADERERVLAILAEDNRAWRRLGQEFLDYFPEWKDHTDEAVAKGCICQPCKLARFLKGPGDINPDGAAGKGDTAMLDPSLCRTCGEKISRHGKPGQPGACPDEPEGDRDANTD